MHWYLVVLKKYFVIRGRARRKEYWSFMLVHILISVLLLGVDVLMRGGLIEAQRASFRLSSLYGWATVVPSITVQVRRLHDMNRTGWWLLLWFVPRLASWTMGFLDLITGRDPVMDFSETGPLLVAMGLVTMAGGLILLVFSCFEGTRGKNRYGSDPTSAYADGDDVWPDVA